MVYDKKDKVIDLDVNIDDYRPLVFFGIDIEQDKENIQEWVRWCSNQGLKGFNIIVGSDCKGRAHDEWLNKLMDAYEHAFQTAKEENLEVWIFDDWGYPSGTAGGLVCQEDSYRAKKLHISCDYIMEAGQSIEIEIPKNFLAAGVIPNIGDYRSLKIDKKTGEKFTYKVDENSVSGERLIFVSWTYDSQEVKSSCKSYPGDPAMSCIDMLNPKATEKFLEVMHERYYQRFAKYMNTLIRGFFYDEPYVSYPFPWTDKLADDFYDKKAYDLMTVLPQILVEAPYAHSGSVLKYANDYFEVWTDMVAESFYGVMAKWCKDRNLELSGHMDLEHRLETLHTISGHFYKNMRFNNRPAIDVIWAQIAPDEFSDYPRYAGSVKRLLGKERATSETFAGMGYGLSGDLMRFITDHQVMRGIDDFHLMYSSNNPPAGETYSPQTPEHILQEPFGKMIYERIATAAAISTKGIPLINTAILLPTGKLNQVKMGLDNLHINNADDLPWNWINKIAEFMVYLPIEFDYIWDEAIMELELVNGGLKTKSDYVIDTIILPPDSTLSERAVEKLKSFQEKGGRIISVFKPFWQLMEKGLMCNQIKGLEKYLKPQIKISNNKGISISSKIINNKKIYYLLNEKNEKQKLCIDFLNKGILSEINLKDLSVLELTRGNELEIELEFLARELKVFVVVEEDRIYDKKFFEEKSGVETIIPEKWRLYLPDGKIVELESNSFPSWDELGYPEYSGALSYEAEFYFPGIDNEAIIEADELYSHGEFYIDGKEIGKSAYCPHKVKIKNLEEGVHKLEIKVYNTPANQICGTLELEKKKYKGRFAGLAHYDRRRLKSGLLAPLKISFEKNI
ncbi:glycosyl hydrolase [Natronospora cellulosivora (SeqCode)]